MFHLNMMSESDRPIANGTESKPASRRLRRGLGLSLIVISGLLGWFLLVGFLGWQRGQHLLVERRQEELAGQLERQVSLARDNIDEGSYDLALRRLQWVLEQDPSYSEAQTLQAEAEQKLGTFLTPTPEPIGTATPTPGPEPGDTLESLDDPDRELQRIQRLVNQERWQEAISALVAFQVHLPDHKRQETDQLLYDAYVNLGLELVNSPQVELGVYYLTQAERLGNLPQAAEDQRLWAELYVQGIAYYGVNWDVAAFYFRDLCLAAPFFHSSCERLVEVLVNYGDQYAAAEDWCPAQPLYEEARQYANNQALAGKIAQAREGCLSATPTPAGPITDTVPITDTQPITDDSPLLDPPPGEETPEP